MSRRNEFELCICKYILTPKNSRYSVRMNECVRFIILFVSVLKIKNKEFKSIVDNYDLHVLKMIQHWLVFLYSFGCVHILGKLQFKKKKKKKVVSIQTWMRCDKEIK